MRYFMKKNNLELFLPLVITCLLILVIYGTETFAQYGVGMNKSEVVAEVETTELLEADLPETGNLESIKLKYLDLDEKEDLILVSEIAEKTKLNYEAASMVLYYARKFELKPSLILATIDLESEFEQYCVGDDGDRGYMQIIPGTEKWLAETFEETLEIEYDPEKIFEPEYNIGLGVAYLSLLKNAYGEDYNRILSEYNRGPYNLKAYYERNKTYETSYSRNILTREKKYVDLNR